MSLEIESSGNDSSEALKTPPNRITVGPNSQSLFPDLLPSLPEPGLEAHLGTSSARIIDELDRNVTLTSTVTTESSRPVSTRPRMESGSLQPIGRSDHGMAAEKQTLPTPNAAPVHDPALLPAQSAGTQPSTSTIDQIRIASATLTFKLPDDTQQLINPLSQTSAHRLRTSNPIAVSITIDPDNFEGRSQLAWLVRLVPIEAPHASQKLIHTNPQQNQGPLQFLSPRPLTDGEYRLEVFKPTPANTAEQAESGAILFAARLVNRTISPQVLHVDLAGLDASIPATAKVVFSTNVVASKDHFSLVRLDASGNAQGNPIPTHTAVSTGATVDLTFNTRLEPGVYQLVVQPAGGLSIVDEHGNPLTGNRETQHIAHGYVTIASDPASVRPGVTGASGNYVAFPEFTEPRRNSSGFNPHDKVETRVARLYYYRDAHRVAQVINRKIRSHHRAGVEMSRQLADQSRTIASQLTFDRQTIEANAIRSAQISREAESRLETSETMLATATRELARATTTDEKKQWEEQIRQLYRRVADERGQVRAAREREFNDQQALRAAEAKEHAARERQFRLETAAAQADPDTYVEGVPGSFDPVEQVSISVIGEGLIQLRGPLKGINIVRTMIDQIDQPIGQVRVQVHTVQINGEREDRMEEVAAAIQRQIDQARFLTLQSAELLRRAIVQTASRRADAMQPVFPGDSQAERDRRYLYAFFGQDFIDELAAMDSEFLHTGNKLLSLHSMDTTSLSSALNLMALAKNSTRMEILDEFQRLLQCELPQAEQNFLYAGVLPGTARRGPFAHKHAPSICYLADKAQFESFRSFFLTDIAGDDTMTPLQREFIRLAQIFKARVITELEYKQRVTERAVIEERESGDYRAQQAEFASLEQAAERKRRESITELVDARTAALRLLTEFKADVDFHTSEIFRQIRSVEAINSGSLEAHQAITDDRRCMSFIDGFAQDYHDLGDPAKLACFKRWAEKKTQFWWTDDVGSAKQRFPFVYQESKNVIGIISTSRIPYQRIAEAHQLLAQVIDNRRAFRVIDEVTLDHAATKLNEISNTIRNQDVNREPEKMGSSEVFMLQPGQMIPLEYFFRIQEALRVINEEHKRLIEGVEYVDQLLKQIELSLSWIDSDRAVPSAMHAYKSWLELHQFLERVITNKDAELHGKLGTLGSVITPRFQALANTALALQAAEQNLQRSRRPLDHKKFLDMLIDELEEKYIELMEGTRAHTANVDNYLKRLTTALDDDFNAQFYQPAFQHIRQTTVHRDVHFGQTETTTVLANNRGFAKVTPSATMEFDLPARYMLMLEALYGAKAGIDDFGALLNDPTFLALARSGLGASVANPAAGSTDGLGIMRTVLPGLSSDVTEQVLAQHASSRPQFGSNLENLIPDPAIYKFETGTGYEIRPVIQPDGQAVVFDFNYLYSTNIREPVRADEKHLGRVKRHFIRTDVQLSNFELREVSRYNVVLKAARTARGVPLFEDIPVAGVLFRPLPNAESSLQQNMILAQATIFPTLFDLMGLRWAPTVTDLDPLRLINSEFLARGRKQVLQNRVYDFASERVDDFLRIPEGNRRPDLYRSQETIPAVHPNGYYGPGLDLRDSPMIEGYAPSRQLYPEHFVPYASPEGAPYSSRRLVQPEFEDVSDAINRQRGRLYPPNK
ncbi:MAG TPA: hypothetical protein PKD54_01360 [Pirellulaceae bacterium]|nr:hypothetical protein [Pirellulaceae bacterium]